MEMYLQGDHEAIQYLNLDVNFKTPVEVEGFP